MEGMHIMGLKVRNIIKMEGIRNISGLETIGVTISCGVIG